jgi:hypothetical protein
MHNPLGSRYVASLLLDRRWTHLPKWSQVFLRNEEVGTAPIFPKAPEMRQEGILGHFRASFQSIQWISKLLGRFADYPLKAYYSFSTTRKWERPQERSRGILSKV